MYNMRCSGRQGVREKQCSGTYPVGMWRYGTSGSRSHGKGRGTVLLGEMTVESFTTDVPLIIFALV